MTAPSSIALECPKEHCYAPRVRCVLGEDLPDCTEYGSLVEEPGLREPEAAAGVLPWTGLGLGVDDIAAVAAVGRPSVVALVGAASAGKTTALAAAFLALRRGKSLGGGRFAGSFTLTGWQIVSSYMQWPPHGNGGFPPHTTALDVRSPCLLHLRLHGEADGVVRELLLSDVPGEWFSAWGTDSNDGAGAAWLAECADSFVLFADSEALASPQRGRARAGYEELARRVHSAATGRPVLPVLSKSDIPVPEPVLAHIARVNTSLFAVDALPISAREPGAPALTALDEAVNVVLRRRAPGSSAAEPSTPRRDDSLLAYRSPVLVEGMRETGV